MDFELETHHLILFAFTIGAIIGLAIGVNI